MVMNIPALKNGKQARFIEDVERVVRAAEGRIVKVITENCFLNDDQKLRACDWIAQAGAHFVETSTAYAGGGATLSDVRLMSRAVRGWCQVKAAGEIHEVLEYLRAGARRFGSTRTAHFVEAFLALPGHERAAFAEYFTPDPPRAPNE
jgi:deoxyribose-phosphate aldolase